MVPEPHLRCLLLLARPRLEPAHVHALNGLLAAPDCDHAALVARAREHHISLLVQAHLRAHAPQVLEAEAAIRLTRNCGIARLRQMEQRRVQTEVLAVLVELGAAHALLKGSVLGVRHYPDPLLRLSRDVDVLVAAAALAEATRRLLACGYTVINKVWPALDPPCIDALASYTTAVELSAPSGVTVELHRTLDHSGCVFPPRRLLRERCEIGMHGLRVSALHADTDMLYSLFHHARHEWTLLHWVADLQGFAPRLDHAEVRARAARHGLTVTLERALELARQVDRLALDPATAGDPGDCLAQAFPAWRDPATHAEHDHDAPPRSPDFRQAGQAGWRYRACFELQRLHPTLDDYLAWPLPLRRRWLYYLSKPLRVLRRGGPRLGVT